MQVVKLGVMMRGGGLSGSSLGGDVEGKVLVLTEVKQGGIRG